MLLCGQLSKPWTHSNHQRLQRKTAAYSVLGGETKNRSSQGSNDISKVQVPIVIFTNEGLSNRARPSKPIFQGPASWHGILHVRKVITTVSWLICSTPQVCLRESCTARRVGTLSLCPGILHKQIYSANCGDCALCTALLQDPAIAFCTFQILNMLGVTVVHRRNQLKEV